MEAGLGVVERDPDPGPGNLAQCLETARLGGLHVGRRDHPQGDAAACRPFEGRKKQPKPAPAQKRHHPVDPGGAEDLRLKFVSKPGIGHCPREKSVFRNPGEGTEGFGGYPSEKPLPLSRSLGVRHLEKELRGGGQERLLPGLISHETGNLTHQGIDEFAASLQPILANLGHRLPDNGKKVACIEKRDLGLRRALLEALHALLGEGRQPCLDLSVDKPL